MKEEVVPKVEEEETPGSDDQIEIKEELERGDTVLGLEEARLLDCKHEEYVHAIHKQKTWDKKYDDQSKQNKQKRFKTPNSKTRSDKGVKRIPDRTFQCNECEYVCAKQKYFKKHMRRHTGERPFACECCDQTFSSSSGLCDHRRRIHSSSRPHQCSECDKAFAAISELKQHKKSHSEEKPFQCTECGTALKSLESLKRHMNSHAGLYPYSCKLCVAKFTSSSHLVRHQGVHSKEKPYKCDHCQQTFTQNDNLKHHVKTVHLLMKDHECDLCGTKFTRKAHLKEHMTCVHKLGEPTILKCDKCGKVFHRRSLLNRHHRQVHLKENRYECLSCDVKFPTVDKLRRHAQSQRHINNTNEG